VSYHRITRRQFLKSATLLAGALSASGCRLSLSQGLSNDCLREPLNKLKQDSAWQKLWQQAWQDIDPRQLWDCHCHLVGTGDSDSGIEVNPDMLTWMHPLQHSQFNFYLNASCAKQSDVDGNIDRGAVARLLQIAEDFPPGVKMMLLAFDHYYDEAGEKHLEYSAFHVPNRYAQRIAGTDPQRFEWIASVHPYRKDALQELQWCADHGAKGSKWLPGAMGINPASPRCDAFYQALIDHKLTLLSHTGSEHAVETPAGQTYNNPLLLRRPLKHGVLVIAAHCASVGDFVDIDAGEDADEVSGYQLFKRIMQEPEFEKNLYGGISATVLINHDVEVLADLIRDKSLHQRLVYGSDYPLPGIIPLINTSDFVDKNWLSEEQAGLLDQLRPSNALLFDFLLKRLLKVDGHSFPAEVFHSRRAFV